MLAGALSLAVAMGIGRFAFTPMLPLMIRAGQLDMAAGGWMAAANYAGYFAGALTAARKMGWLSLARPIWENDVTAAQPEHKEAFPGEKRAGLCCAY